MMLLCLRQERRIVAIRWNQPLLENNEATFVLPTPRGDRRVTTTGVVPLAVDTDGNILLTVAQEPAARHNSKFTILKTPFQTSGTKAKQVMEGDTSKDPNFHSLILMGNSGASVSEVFRRGLAHPFSMSTYDGNRMYTRDFGFVMRTPDELRDQMTNNEQNRWVSPYAVTILTEGAWVNGPTTLALQSSGEIRRRLMFS